MSLYTNNRTLRLGVHPRSRNFRLTLTVRSLIASGSRATSFEPWGIGDLNGFQSMRRCLLTAIAVVALFSSPANSQALSNQATSTKAGRLQLANEFIRELYVLYELQQTAKKEFAEDNSATGRLATAVRVGTRTIFEMNTSIHQLDQIGTSGKWDDFRSMLRKFDEDRISLTGEMTEGAKKLLRGPEPGVNYGELNARAPELTASVEELDKLIFQMSQALFLGLIDDDRVGSDGQLHYLILTKKQRNEMIKTIDLDFGSSLNDKNATHIVNAAWAMRYGLTLPKYRSSDEN
jgi:hypothetical protein